MFNSNSNLVVRLALTGVYAAVEWAPLTVDRVNVPLKIRRRLPRVN